MYIESHARNIMSVIVLFNEIILFINFRRIISFA